MAEICVWCQKPKEPRKYDPKTAVSDTMCEECAKKWTEQMNAQRSTSSSGSSASSPR
jgi:hypothetical protein